MWWDESERVAFDAKARFSKSRAAIERAQESANKKKATAHGRYFVAEPKVIDGGDWPTRDEWLQEQAKKNGTSKPVGKFNNSERDSNIVQGRK